MFDTDPTGWTWSTWWLYTMSAFYLLGVVVFWFRFAAAERRARQSVEAARRYNLLLRGFPNAIYAKMFGKRPFDVPKADAQPPHQGD